MDDDGEVIDELSNDTGLLLLYPGANMSVIIPKMMGDVDVPEHIRLVASLAIFLRYRDNVEQVLKYLPKKNPDYKAN